MDIPNGVGEVVVEPHREPSEVLQPGVEPLNLPWSAVSPELPSVLRLRLHAPASMRRNEFDELLVSTKQRASTEQSHSLVAVAGAVSDDRATAAPAPIALRPHSTQKAAANGSGSRIVAGA